MCVLTDLEAVLEEKKQLLAQLDSQRGEHTASSQQTHLLLEDTKEEYRQSRERAERLLQENAALLGSHGLICSLYAEENRSLFERGLQQGNEITALKLQLDDLRSQIATSSVRTETRGGRSHQCRCARLACGRSLPC